MKALQRSFYSLFLVLIQFQLVFANYDSCKGLFDYLYKELTINTLDLSLDRSYKKLLLGLYHVHDKTNNKYSIKPKMTKLFNKISKIDAELAKKIKNNDTTFITNLLTMDSTDDNSQLSKVFQEWYQFQFSSPELFEDLPEKYQIDSWDLKTIELVNKASSFQFSHKEYGKHIKKLANAIKSQKESILKKNKFDSNFLKQSLDKSHKNIVKRLKENMQETFKDYGHLCNEKSYEILKQLGEISCPINEDFNSPNLISKELLSLANKVSEPVLRSGYPLLDEKNNPIDSKNLIYQVSPSANATFCMRPPEMVSTIVLHHSATNKDITPYEINSMHLNNGSPDDPWFMFGYNFMVSSHFEGSSKKMPKVFNGRPDYMKGAHAGGYTKKLTDEEKAFYDTQIIRCGNTDIGFTEMKATEQINAEGGISGNLVSFGVLVPGNFAKPKVRMIDGIPIVESSYKQDQINHAELLKVAKLSCEIQKKYPRVKKIVPHSYFKPSTECPGDIIDELENIAKMAKNFGCHFEVERSK